LAKDGTRGGNNGDEKTGFGKPPIFEEIISVPLVIDDVSLTPRTAVLGHLNSDVTQSKSKPLVSLPLPY